MFTSRTSVSRYRLFEGTNCLHVRGDISVRVAANWYEDSTATVQLSNVWGGNKQLVGLRASTASLRDQITEIKVTLFCESSRQFLLQ